MFFRGNTTINLQCQISIASFLKALHDCREARHNVMCNVYFIYGDQDVKYLCR